MTQRRAASGFLPALFLLFAGCALILWAGTALAAPTPHNPREHLVFWQGTPQEIEVFKLHGAEDGPTVMLLGGIHGNEPGAYLSADSYVDLSLRRGHLIIVPRANFTSVITGKRGPGGDMNRKFDAISADDPDVGIIRVLKSLMAESDALITLHDGSGFYRPVWESESANPNRYGQSIIIDAAEYRHPANGTRIPLAEYARSVQERLNAAIALPLHKFHVFNMETATPDSPYQEHLASATYYALTRFGIPAFCVETSKQLPDLRMKILHHNMAVDAFLDLFGVELEPPALSLPTPELAYLVLAVDGFPPLAVGKGQTLLVAPGSSLRVLHMGGNYSRGLSLESSAPPGRAGRPDRAGQARRLHDPARGLTVDAPVTLTVRKDGGVIGSVHIALLPDGSKAPTLSGEIAFKAPSAATPATLDMLPGSVLLAALEAPPPAASPVPPATVVAANPQPSSSPVEKIGVITGFQVAVNGSPVTVAPDTELVVPSGARLTLVDLTADGPLPDETVMNLKGFVPKGQELSNSGDDRGYTAHTGQDLMARFSEGGHGELYPLQAELGNNTVLARCLIRVATPALESVTLRFDGATHSVKPGSRIRIAPGTPVELLGVALRNGLTLHAPRYTLAGHPVPASLPQTLTMREIAINLAIFDGDTLLGKVTWVPKK